MQDLQAQFAERIIRNLRDRGFQAYLVGGCVRDLLLGRTPKDYDIATDARPEQVMELYPEADRVGAHFGVVLIHDSHMAVEVATFRSDSDYQDGRRPERVQFETDPRQDVLRRDFTINGLLLDTDTGAVIDYVGGQADLNAGLVRAIGDPRARFREDHLRLLRAIRFATRLGFSLERDTEAAMAELHSLVKSVSAERVRDELVRILTEGGARTGFELLDRTGLLEVLLPEVAAMKGVEQPPEFHPEGDVWVHTLLILGALPAGSSPELALGALLHDVGKPPTFRIAERIRFDGHVEAGVRLTQQILSRLRFSNEQMEQVEGLVGNHMKFADAQRMKESTLKRFLRLPKFSEHLELHRLDCTFSNGHLDNYKFVQDKALEFGKEEIAPERLLGGKDLIAAGYTPGPEFSRILNQVEDAQLEGLVRTKEEALAMALRISPPISEPAST